MTHRMILMDADFREVKKVLIARRKQASQAQQAAHMIRTQKSGVQFLHSAHN